MPFGMIELRTAGVDLDQIEPRQSSSINSRGKA
jgi:hypothetical protein